MVSSGSVTATGWTTAPLCGSPGRTGLQGWFRGAGRCLGSGDSRMAITVLTGSEEFAALLRGKIFEATRELRDHQKRVDVLISLINSLSALLTQEDTSRMAITAWYRQYGTPSTRERMRQHYGLHVWAGVPRGRTPRGSWFICETCTKHFYRRQSFVLKGVTRFCSRACVPKSVFRAAGSKRWTAKMVSVSDASSESTDS